LDPGGSILGGGHLITAEVEEVVVPSRKWWKREGDVISGLFNEP
jgi:hypothetical protein